MNWGTKGFSRSNFRGVMLFLAFVSFAVAMCVAPGSSFAAAHGPAHVEESVIAVQGPATVGPNDTVENVVTIGYNANIAGHVTDTVFVVRGNVHLSSTARVGMVIALGGRVIKDPGSRATEVYSISFSEPMLNSIAVGSAMVFAAWVTKLCFSALLIVLPVAIFAVLRRRLEVPADVLKTSRRRVGLIGLFTSLCVMALSALCAVTVVGIPLAGLLLLLYGATGLVGLAVVAADLGEWTRVIQEPQALNWRHSIVGTLLITAFGNIPLIGPIVLFIAWCLGIGAMTVWMNRSVRHLRRKRS